MDHVVQAVFDTLGQLDFLLAREQGGRAHLAHVHAHRVGGAAEFGVDRGQRYLGLFFGLVVGGDRRAVAQQQRFGIRRLLVDLHAHFGERVDDAFHRRRVGEVFRQVVADIGVGQVPALLAQLDQGTQLLATRGGLGRGIRLSRGPAGGLA
ncbi:hypothetical protein D3C81_1067470 [compost metagenome]